MKISELAKNAGVNIETIRYYERKKLIIQPKKPTQGYRIYSKAALERILFIKRAKELGFTLREIENLLLLGEGECLSIQKIAQQKLTSVREKIVDLNRLENVLDHLVTQCENNAIEASCPIVESLLPKT